MSKHLERPPITPIRKQVMFLYFPLQDQISVYFVNDKLKNLTGVPGVFVAALLSAALR
jgi:hypothetical protein